MEDSAKTYKKGLKGIAVFGSLQVYKIILSVITTKISALFLGPAGSGIYGLISSMLMTSEIIISCGLSTSAVKDFSQAQVSGDNNKISNIYTSLNRLSFITGLIGTIVVIIFSSQLSNLAFGSDEYASWLIILAVTILINQLTSGQGAFLTGLRRYKLLARQRLIGGGLSALITGCSYYLLGINGIVPTILLTSITNLTVSYLIVRGVKIPNFKINFIESLRFGLPMLKMGISIGLSYAIIALTGFLIRAYISHMSDVATVGLFTASFSLINTYLGLVFSSIESDYYPRLSAIVTDKAEYKSVMLNEMELLIFLLTPLVALLVVFAQPVLAIFYSTKFFAAKTIISWSAFSMLVRIPGWAMSIGIICSGNTILYLKNQLFFCFYQLILNIIGFNYGGLTGLGVSFVIAQLIFLFQNFYIQHKYNNLTFNAQIIRLMVLSSGVIFCLCMLVTFVDSILLLFGVGGLLSVLTVFYCFNGLNKRVPIIQLIKSKNLKH